MRCIRCSACLNVCPVYERSGGHAYGSVYPGPIGAILSPQLFATEASLSLPWASTLCGACYEVCPVRIDIPRVLVHLREKVISDGHKSKSEEVSFRLMALALNTGGRFDLIQQIAARLRRPLNRLFLAGSLPGVLGKWRAARQVPEIPEETFRMWWRANRSDDGN